MQHGDLALSHADIADFVAAYMDGPAERTVGSGDLLRDIAEAYVAHRALPASAVAEVMTLVDSVL